MRVRPARLADVTAIADLVERAYRPYVVLIGLPPRSDDDDYAKKVRRGGVFVADDDGVIGLIVLVASPSTPVSATARWAAAPKMASSAFSSPSCLHRRP